VRTAKILMLSSAMTAGIFSVASTAGANPATITNSSIAPMPLSRALNQFSQQTGLQLVYVSKLADGLKTAGAPSGLSPEATLRALLAGTGLHFRFINATTVTIAASSPGDGSRQSLPQTQPAQAVSGRGHGVETVVVTAEKKRENIQTVPIAISAFTQKELTERQIAGGPDLVKEVPNLTFTKTNFTGYNLEIRGIGTQAISVATDPAVAVAFNETPFLRNHFFEQEFFDVENVQVLRGPQGTLFGRNATAGVVNVVSAKPTDHFEAMMSADYGNYNNKRYEGMINIPLVGNKLMLRAAGEWIPRPARETPRGSRVAARLRCGTPQ